MGGLVKDGAVVGAGCEGRGSVDWHVPASRSPPHVFAKGGQVLEDGGQVVKGELGFEGTFDEGGLVHAVDDRGGLVLARVKPPAARMVLQPSTPSRPMPVMMMPTTPAWKTRAADWNSTSTDGLWPLTGGSSESSNPRA